jgi:hypothetical protein
MFLAAKIIPDPGPADSDLDSVQYLWYIFRKKQLLSTLFYTQRKYDSGHRRTVPSPLMTAFTNLRMFCIYNYQQNERFFKI